MRANRYRAKVDIAIRSFFICTFFERQKKYQKKAPKNPTGGLYLPTKPTRTRAQSPSVRTFLGFALAQKHVNQSNKLYFILKILILKLGEAPRVVTPLRAAGGSKPGEAGIYLCNRCIRASSPKTNGANFYLMGSR